MCVVQRPFRSRNCLPNNVSLGPLTSEASSIFVFKTLWKYNYIHREGKDQIKEMLTLGHRLFEYPLSPRTPVSPLGYEGVLGRGVKLLNKTRASALFQKKPDIECSVGQPLLTTRPVLHIWHIETYNQRDPGEPEVKAALGSADSGVDEAQCSRQGVHVSHFPHSKAVPCPCPNEHSNCQLFLIDSQF